MPEVHVLPDAVSSENVDRVVNQAVYQFRAQKAENKRTLHLATRRLFKFEGITGVCKATIMAGTLVLFLLITDGSRRDSGEFSVVVNSCDSGVLMQAGETKGSATVSEQSRLAAADALQTPIAGEATLGFADGSGLIVGMQSLVDIASLDFARNGRRDHSVFLHAGRLMVRVSPYFGANRNLVSTPVGLIAAKSGSAFAVAYDPKTSRCDVDVLSGNVVVRTAEGRWNVKPGQRAILTGAKASGSHTADAPFFILNARVGKLSRKEARENGAESGSELVSHFAQLAKKNERLKTLDTWGKPGLIQNMERAVMKTLDPALQKVGWTAHGFSLADNDAARRAQTAAQLKRLSEAFAEGENGEAPAVLNPVTLSPLSLSDKERDAILGAFAGKAIDEYRKTGANGEFVLRVRARDRAATQFELTGAGVREIGPSPLTEK